jgi:hypothetical protein
MKTRIALLVMALMFLSALIICDLQLVKGQTAPMEKRVTLSKYGVVLSIPGPNGREVTFLQHEGYAVAYRIKNPNTGKEEDRLAYAFGQQVVNLESVPHSGTQAIVRTKDGALEITSEAQWDEKLNELRAWRSVTATTALVVLAIESHADAVRRATYPDRVRAVLQVTQSALLAGFGISGRIKKCDCPPCPLRGCSVGFRLPSGGFRASQDMVKSADDVSALIAGGAGMPEMTEMSKGSVVNVLSWKRDVNMPSEPIAPGKGLTAFTGYMFK